jgi:hypothetical protein
MSLHCTAAADCTKSVFALKFLKGTSAVQSALPAGSLSQGKVATASQLPFEWTWLAGVTGMGGASQPETHKLANMN